MITYTHYLISASNISRIAITGISSRSSAGRDDENTFTGDVVLRFNHIPSCEVSCNKGTYNNNMCITVV
jgi:hypothetical protein